MDSKTFAVRDALQCANSSQKDLLEVNLFENYLTDCAGKVCLLLQTWFISGPPVSLNALTATASGRVLHSQNIAVFVVVPQGGCVAGHYKEHRSHELHPKSAHNAKII